MRVLLVNKFHYIKGGSEKYYFELGKLLKENGHEVAYFSMEDDKNITTGGKEYFVKKSDMNSKNIFKALDVIYSRKNYTRMVEAIEDFKPDIIHLNNFQRQLSASVVMAAYKKHIPMVFTAHDLQAICPAITMLDSDNKVCEKCMHHKYMNCYKKKCIKNSRLKSLLGAIENYYYNHKKIFTRKISHIITPSNFYRNKFIEEGINENKITCIHNFIDVDSYDIPTSDKGYILYLGRLSKEKGIYNLIKAVEKSKEKNPDIKLFIVGDGPEKENISRIAEMSGLKNNIKLLGFLNNEEVKKYVSECSFMVIPSIWYENGPYSVLEAQCIGKAIIGANIGGIPEFVKDNVCGLTYSYESAEELSLKINELLADKAKLKQYSKKAKEMAREEYNSKSYYDKIIKVYEKVINH